MAACMRQRGFSYQPEPLAEGDHRPDNSPYGLLTPTQAANDGFGVTSAALNARPAPDGNAAKDDESAWKAALLGTESHRMTVSLPAGQQFFYNSDACVIDAIWRLYGPDYYRLFNTFQVLTNQVVDKVEKDPRYLAAQTRWQNCMKASGQNAAVIVDPPAEINRELQQAGTDSVKLHQLIGHELQLAGTDAQCQKQADLATAVAQAQSDAEKAVIGAHGADLATLKKLRQAALDRASR